MSNNKMLSVKDLNVSYQTLHVLFDVSIEIDSGEVVVVVGRNGAGKTTLFRTIAGFLNQDSGAITFKGERTLVTSRLMKLPYGGSNTFNRTNMCLRICPYGKTLNWAVMPLRIMIGTTFWIIFPS